MKKKRILVALSGGVDSSVVATLLKEEGNQVVGVYMKNWINEENILGECPWEEDLEDAKKVAELLGIEFRILDLTSIYRKKIVDAMLSDYQRGWVPNPDAWCNREIKFGVLLDYALEQGFDEIATGHYARKKVLKDGESQLLRGFDKEKDQSYFLALLKKEQLEKAIFPIGELKKSEVRKIAEKNRLPTAKKKDSQGICFIGKVKMKDFLAHFLPNKEGDILDIHGKFLGKHQGLHFYTLGQRKGHKIASPYDENPYIVVSKDKEKNQLILALEEENAKELYSSSANIGECSWLNFPKNKEIDVQIRYRSASVKAGIIFLEKTKKVKINFAEEQKALALGQVCAFYENEILLGGGIFQSIEYGKTFS